MPTVIVRICQGSDGDASHVPGPQNGRTPHDPPALYLEKLGESWMKHRGVAKAGTQYVLDQLPHGYTVWQRRRTGSPQHVDRWLYGHPEHKTFDSPNRFLPHFIHLMEHGGSSFGCACTVCLPRKTVATQPMVVIPHRRPQQTPGSGNPQPTHGTTNHEDALEVPARAPHPVPRQRGRSKLPEPGTVDEEGNPDVYQALLDKLKRVRSLDEQIQESLSMDWRLERRKIGPMLERVSQQPAWIPRLGEIVLFIRQLEDDEEIRFDPTFRQLKIWQWRSARWKETAPWEAGVVAEVASDIISLQDVSKERDKEYQVNYSGFRVEPLPDPNGTDKRLSKRYKYVPSSRIRPFSMWKDCLDVTMEQDWHATIKHALTAMSSFALVEKYRFRGTWPSASILCRAIYLGSELICLGDVVCVVPRGEQEQATDALHVTSIILRLQDLDRAEKESKDARAQHKSAVYLIGKCYTTDPFRGTGVAPVARTLPSQLQGYGRWQWLHDPVKLMQLPLSRIMGRCYEAGAQKVWFAPPDGEAAYPSLSAGLGGVTESRSYARNHDQRIIDDQKWYWADSRADALDLEIFNGVNVAGHDEERDPHTWRKLLKVLDGVAADEDTDVINRAERAEERAMKRLGPANSLVQSSMQPLDTDNDASGPPSKRGSSADEPMQMDGEDSEEFDDEALAGHGQQETALGHEQSWSIGLARSDEEISSDDSESVAAEQAVKRRRLESYESR